jgi:hypothetical protein
MKVDPMSIDTTNILHRDPETRRGIRTASWVALLIGPDVGRAVSYRLSPCSHTFSADLLGPVDKWVSPQAADMFQGGLCSGGELGTRPYVGRRVGVL